MSSLIHDQNISCFDMSLLLSVEFGDDTWGFRGDPRFERIAPHNRGDFVDLEGSERVPWEGFHRHGPDLPAHLRRHWGQHDFCDDNHDCELENRNSRGTFAHSPGSISHRYPSLFSDSFSDNYRSPSGNLSLRHDSHIRQRPVTHRDHNIHHGYSPNPHRYNDHRSRSQASWNSVAQHERGGGISRVNGPLSPNRGRTGQRSIHSSSSSDLTVGTVI